MKALVRALAALALLVLLIVSATAQAIAEVDSGKVIAGIADLLESRYVDPAKGKQLATDIRRASKQFDTVQTGPAFAEALTKWLRDQSRDGHLSIDFSKEPIPEKGGDESFHASEIERYYGAHVNHGVQKIERLDGNIILIDLRVFPPVEMAGDVFAAMMTIAAQGDALIIDLRKNGGGMDTGRMMTGYLLKPGSPLSGSYSRPNEKLTESFSPDSVPGRRFGESKPVYILTSKRTFSAAEAVAYDLQALKRATIIGEVTGGGAHPFEYRRIHPHFALSLPEQKSVNPITGTNWQDVGVQPDIAVPADQALDKAVELARAAIAKKS